MFSSRLSFSLLVASLISASASAQTVTAVLPNGREIRPAGRWIQLAPYPFALAVRPDGRQIAIPSIGFPFALNVVDAPESASPASMRMPKGTTRKPEIEVHAGLAYSPDGKLLYVATGDSGKVAVYRTADWSKSAEFSLDGAISGKEYKRSFAATLAASADGKTLFILDQANWRVVIFRVASGDGTHLTRIASIPTGRYPYSLALSPNGRQLYVTNTGLFEYTSIPGPPNAQRGSKDDPGLRFPPFGYPSKAAREGAIVEGKRVAGLGDENSVKGSSLWTYDISNPASPAITAKLRLGAKITDEPGETIGGAAPTGVAADATAVYVALAHQDAVAKISTDGKTVLAQTELTPFTTQEFKDSNGRPLRGIMPSGIAVQSGRVYVAESGINAVGVLAPADPGAANTEAANLTVIEHIPTGWNPSALAFSPDGRFLYVTNAKGKGAGPNGGKNYDPFAPTYVGTLDYGSLSILDLTALPDPQTLTKTVLETNLAATREREQLPHLKHCFLIVRENRTYDELLGDVTGGNGDPTIARYGLDGWTEEDKSVRHLKVSPNLHALAARFAISDNFYVDSDVSADGHRWVVGANPTPFFNTAWSSGYGGRRKGDPPAESSAPGRRAIFGGADAPMPEDEPQFGTLWEHIANAYQSGNGILNYGESLEVEGNDERDGTFPEGQRLYLNSPIPRPVFEATDRNFPTFNLGIPDQLRFDEFKRDFSARLAKGEIPALIVIRLPNDHMTRPRPEDGYPYRASYVADNDLALGKIVEYLSTTPIWRDSALFVTEDDAQGGVDHVDAHRSILAIASPWLKPGSISHSHTDFGSITRTIDGLLGLGPNNLEDALAGPLTGIFDTEPHLDPFTAAPSDPRIFVPANAKVAKPKTRREAAELLDMDDANEISRHMQHTRSTLRRPVDND
jgi:DNA-binding beta-propeller fold protein YncE